MFSHAGTTPEEVNIQRQSDESESGVVASQVFKADYVEEALAGR